MTSLDSRHDNKANELIISLLGRIAFTNDTLRQMVVHGKKKPVQMVKVYNLCDGVTTVSKIAKKAKVGQPAVSRAVDRWIEQGIISKNVTGGEVFPRKLYTIEKAKKNG